MIAEKKCGLRKEVQERIISVFKQNQLIDRSILFGSRAMGNFKVASDIDLVLEGQKLQIQDLLTLQNALDDLLLPLKIDLSLLHLIDNPQFIEHIKKFGLEFYTRA